MTATPRPGDFFLAPIPGDVGKLIRAGIWMNGEGMLKYQHAGILLDGNQTIEAMPGGAIIGHISRWKPEELRWSTGLIELTASQSLDIVHYARAREGVPYSFLDYAAISAHRFGVPTPRLKKFIANSDHMICSQLVDWVYLQAGVHLFEDGRWPGYVTPGSLNKLLDTTRIYNFTQGL